MTGETSSGRADPPRRHPVELVVSAADVDLVADRLFSAGASAVSESTALHGSVTLVADVDPARLEGLGLAYREVEVDPSWSSSWESGARAWHCGERLSVRPVWVDPPSADGAGPRVEVLVDPGASFGSASHPTTRLCLAALEPLAPEANRVLDVGCGSGVLGVAAVLLGGGALRAIDTDPEAVRATARAFDSNGLGGDPASPAVVDATPLGQVAGVFDLVLANLLAPILEDLGPALVDRLADGGSLVVGGVLSAQADRVLAALAPLQVRSTLVDGDWVAIVVGHPAPRSPDDVHQGQEGPLHV